jgi:hypothetical protein
MDHLYLHSLTLPLFSDARLANAARTRENCVLSREEAVTPEDEARIRELPGLIATERDPEKIKLFAGRTGGREILGTRTKSAPLIALPKWPH